MEPNNSISEPTDDLIYPNYQQIVLENILRETPPPDPMEKFKRRVRIISDFLDETS